MGAPRDHGRVIARETLLAVLVLALCCLSFAHKAVATPAGYTLTSTDAWCGESSLPAGSDHAACHACRLGEGAALPPPPCGAERALTVAAVAYGLPGPLAAFAEPDFATSARGPPLTV